MKKIYSLLAAVLFAGSMMAAPVDATMAAGTNGSAAVVNGNSAIKVGTAKAGGDMTITVGEGATTLSLYAAAWKGVNGLSLNITAPAGVTVSPASISLTADVGISNNSPFTLSGDEDDFHFDITLSGVSSETTLTLAGATAKRFVVWGAQYEVGASDPDEPAISAAAVNFGTIYVAEGAAAEPIVKELTVTGANLSEAIEAAGSENVAVEGELDEEGGVLTLTITPAAGEFNETITLTSGATSKEVAVTGNVVEVHEYSVDEAIAASLQDNDFVGVKGVVTKMEIKPKNFLQYGSVNIYVADAEGGEGEFEFYNCYSLSADTFKVTVPAITDATSTTWTQLESVADVNNVNVAVGDTVVAWGKYTYYASNDMHELNTGCYLVSITKPGSVVPSALPALSGEQKAAKRVLNGQLIIERDGLRYNAQGTLLR